MLLFLDLLPAGAPPPIISQLSPLSREQKRNVYVEGGARHAGEMGKRRS